MREGQVGRKRKENEGKIVEEVIELRVGDHTAL